MNEDSEKHLGKIKKLDVRKIWKNEAADFTAWLANDENISQLGRAIGFVMGSNLDL